MTNTKGFSDDKIYGTYDQYSELWIWCKQHKPQALNYFYQRAPFYDKTKTMIICLFPKEINQWMLENCDIEWVIKRIKEQYER